MNGHLLWVPCYKTPIYTMYNKGPWFQPQILGFAGLVGIRFCGIYRARIGPPRFIGPVGYRLWA